MAKKLVSLRLDQALLEAIDVNRGDTPRTAWIEQALLGALRIERVGDQELRHLAQNVEAESKRLGSLEAKAGVMPVERIGKSRAR